MIGVTKEDGSELVGATRPPCHTDMVIRSTEPLAESFRNVVIYCPPDSEVPPEDSIPEEDDPSEQTALLAVQRDPSTARVIRKLSLQSVPMEHRDGMAAPGEKTAGLCYKYAAQFALRTPETVLVHGILHPAIGDRAGLPYEHAWVIFGDLVFEPILQKFFPRSEYYAAFAAEERVITPHRDVAKTLCDFRHWGPWTADCPPKPRRRNRRTP